MGILIMKENLLIDKSIVFASRIIKLHQYLIRTKKEAVISKQIVRSGTSIGANINEASYGQSKADFVSKSLLKKLFFNFLIASCCNELVMYGAGGFE